VSEWSIYPITNPNPVYSHSILHDNTSKERIDRAIAQAVSRRLPTTVSRFRSQVRSSGICGGQRGAEAGYFRVLRFPLPILIPPTAPHSSSIIWGWYNRPVVADVPSGLSLTPPQETKKKKKWENFVDTFRKGCCRNEGFIICPIQHLLRSSSPWKWRKQVRPKRWYLSMIL
jgi:hypothetical protein